MIMVREQAGAFRVGRTRANTSPFGRIVGLAFAAAIEGALVYVLLVTLGVAPKPAVVPPFIGRLLPADETVPLPPPPPPPNFEAPQVQTTITPEVQIQLVEPLPNAITEPTPPPQPPQRVTSIELTPQLTLSPARALLATHTTPDYPPVSRRLGEQGTLRLKLTITTQGAVSEAMVINSSGHSRLDEAAIEWVKAHWRYQPAMRGSTPVPSTADAVVTFKLQ
ncbi:MAG TPA: energy transducer TonB [Micropepsaceae bacterium]|nr:energy transducer TonB [Micropepsaceae bacterium]